VAGGMTFVVVAWLLLAGCAAPTQRDGPLATLPTAVARMSALFRSREPATGPPSPTSTPDMLVPTPLVSGAAAVSHVPVATSSPAASVAAKAMKDAVTTLIAKLSPSSKIPGPDRRRVCVGVPIGQITDYDWGGALPGWYMDWHVREHPPEPGGARFAQTVITYQDSYLPSLNEITATARSRPGSLWLIGNEPDVVAQDSSTPKQYAKTYGILYRAIKDADPTAQVAIAGVSQPTPLRMAYLDRILAAYRQEYGHDMPVDVWNVHAYVLREERNSWGVGIPPGMEVDRGRLYEIEDHGDMAIFRQQIADFRQWMAQRGQRDKPLIVSEYGILMPEDYGFPPDVVGQYLVDTFDYFLTARDPQIGYPVDDNRLVQAFCWFSAASDKYRSANLFDLESHASTPVGDVFRTYVAALK
jgi:hypothetical protein